jgi:hypothetical protein
MIMSDDQSISKPSQYDDHSTTHGVRTGDGATFNGSITFTINNSATTPQSLSASNPTEPEKVPINVFISYRRGTSLYFAKSVKEHLQPYIAGEIFLDFTSLGAGQYEEQIFNELRRSHVALLMISVGTFDRIHEPEDWVAREIKEGLKRTLIPVLQGGAITLPKKRDLPKDIQSLTDQQSVRLYEEHFDEGIRRIVEMIHKRY